MKPSLLTSAFLFLLVFNFLSCHLGPVTVTSGDSVISLNGSWSFKYYPGSVTGSDSLFYRKDFNISGWDSIIVPGHWDLQGFAEPNYRSPMEGTGLYRTLFRVPGEWVNTQIFIRFEGVLYGYDVYVNGNYAGSWSSSFNAKDFNVTDFVNPGEENILAVKVITRPEGYGYDLFDGWALCGIFRGVELISVPDIHISNYTVRTYLTRPDKAVVKAETETGNPENKAPGNLVLKADLISPEGKLIGKKEVRLNNLPAGSISFKVRNPELWTAETPVLYTLNLMLVQNGSVIQTKIQPVGIRELSIENAVLRLNGSPLKLRGIDHHDTGPENGKTFTGEEIYRDLSLMKKANINFIRTSHYPPDRRLLDMCDSMGFYVLCEVPINSGNITDTTFLGLLLDRAKATLLRDKNHPSIIFWSIGNENPLTPLTEITGKYVQQADPTRPICYPQRGDYFEENYEAFPDFFELLTPHYRSAAWLRNFAQETSRPVILTEFAHAQGLSFGHLEDIWSEMFCNEKIAGGAVWVFQDQGIRRESDKPVNIKEPTFYVWVDSVTYYDTHDIQGCDGIVYADRTPQTDYRQIQRVYSPVQIIETELAVTSGTQALNFRIYNQYDFLNLNVFDGKWKLYKNRMVTGNGSLSVDCAPHDTVKINLPVTLPEDPGKDIYRLCLEFTDSRQHLIQDHTIKLITSDKFEAIKDSLRKEIKKNVLVYEIQPGSTGVLAGDFRFIPDPGKLTLSLINEKNSLTLMSGNLYARTGRTVKIVDNTIRDRLFPDTKEYYWDPFLLEAAEVTDSKATKSDSVFEFSATASFYRGKKFPGQKLEGKISFIVRANGVMTVKYDLGPVSVSGYFLEAGISFRLPETYTDFQWIGDGPYSSYPDKHRLNDFGFHSMKKGDINFNGNRRNVEIAVITDARGNGIAVIGDKSDISVEMADNRIILSHNALLTGLSNKLTLPAYLVAAGDVDRISGSLEIVPLKENEWPGKLEELIPYPDPGARPYMPYYHTYDYSR